MRQVKKERRCEVRIAVFIGARLDTIAAFASGKGGVAMGCDCDYGPQKLTGAAHAALLTLQRQAAQDCV
ncbi:hypothetical protein [Paraburkholderia sediminicola]|uniref:hypothetical protein n=1 Tax=Paraburkholderia sediminicola TaxID=458836 RepID=UPI0038B8407F